MHWFWRAAISTALTCIYGASTSFNGPLNATHNALFRSVVQLEAHLFDGSKTSLDEQIGWAVAWVLPYCLLLLVVFGLLTVCFPRDAAGGETLCRKCGYNLRGISEPRCPECGERI
jgi:hypothetical protein